MTTKNEKSNRNKFFNVTDEFRRGEIMDTANNSKTSVPKVFNFIQWMLRAGIACTFIGHGMNALAIKQNWIPLLTVYGFSIEQAKTLLPVIGMADVVVALIIFFHPFRIVVMWAIFWTFITALTRFIAGEGIWEFIERAANWSAPLALLLLSNLKTGESNYKWIKLSQTKEATTNRASLKKLFSAFCLLFFLTESSTAQSLADSSKLVQLKPVNTESIFIQGTQTLDDIQGTYIFSGKKTEVIPLSKSNVALTEKYARQIFSKIPGVFVYDMDGTGNQVNISTRGLDAHRSWEFNIRKDGIITNSDMYGYPASHYNIPMEAVDRIEMVSGTAALQYGAQFGGMLNYISKQPDTSKVISFESINTIGSYGLVSTYEGFSGKINKFRYTAWANKKQIDGYRKNGDSQYGAQGLSVFYDASKKLHLKLDWTHSNYIVHLPGPLTDQQFHTDARMATRSRNYYNPNIHIPSFSLDWKPGKTTTLQFLTSAVIGARNSVLFDKPATVADTISATTLQYTNRQVDIDHFNSYTTELRFLQSYSLFKRTSTFVAGVQYMNNDLHRQQLGKGTTGSDFDLTLVTPGWGRDLHYLTSNFAFFFENHFVISSKFSMNAGMRFEKGGTWMTGTTTYYSDSQLPTEIKHAFPLIGITGLYALSDHVHLHGGYSNAYRPVIFKDIIPASIYEQTDKNLKDAFGYTGELGLNGKYKNLSWSITGFYLKYANRMGTLAQQDENGNLIIFRTNIGDSHTSGIELSLQQEIKLGFKTHISFFTASSFMDARYENAVVKSGNVNVNIAGNKVESVPEWISRNGISFYYSKISLSAQYSYTSGSFADALNTTDASLSGATGYVPAYQLVDLNIAFHVTAQLKLQFNLNNLLDEHYFTKRPQFYPGPGIWPSDGRTFSGTIVIKI